MSRPVHERLRDLEDDVRDLRVRPAVAVRARGRQRGRRQLTVLAVAGAVVAATAGVAATNVLGRPDQDTVAADGPPRVDCVLALPGSPSDVRIRVLDGGAPAGLSGTTASELRVRRFSVLVGAVNADAGGVAAVTYGPAAVGAAAVVRAEVHGAVDMRFVPERRDVTIDLTLGPAFTRLATTTEVNQNLVTAGKPSAPPQCSAVASPIPGR
jgi:hypothetical protein